MRPLHGFSLQSISFKGPEHAPNFKADRKRRTGARRTHKTIREEWASLSVKTKAIVLKPGYRILRNNRMVDPNAQVRIQDPAVMKQMPKKELLVQLRL